MSTDAASILAKGNDILASMGIEADFESNATEIDSKKVYPNDPCPCGSGKKYKKCCGINSNRTDNSSNCNQNAAGVIILIKKLRKIAN